LAPDLVDKGVGILQYADDTVLCLSHDPEKAVNLKLLLYLFELMSGLKIKILKSEIFTINADNETTRFYSDLFNCQVGQLPMKYLGMPLTFAKLKKKLIGISSMLRCSKNLIPGLGTPQPREVA
jgi:hypothetical protein